MRHAFFAFVLLLCAPLATQSDFGILAEPTALGVTAAHPDSEWTNPRAWSPPDCDGCKWSVGIRIANPGEAFGATWNETNSPGWSSGITPGDYDVWFYSASAWGNDGSCYTTDPTEPCVWVDDVCNGGSTIFYRFDHTKYEAIKIKYLWYDYCAGDVEDLEFNGSTFFGPIRFVFWPDNCGCGLMAVSKEVWLQRSDDHLWEEHDVPFFEVYFRCDGCPGGA